MGVWARMLASDQRLGSKSARLRSFDRAGLWSPALIAIFFQLLTACGGGGGGSGSAPPLVISMTLSSNQVMQQSLVAD
ncbi:MAG TPA: hypothetical protein VF848_05135, partial [Steroidobacteraceae bacterium]